MFSNNSVPKCKLTSNVSSFRHICFLFLPQHSTWVVPVSERGRYDDIFLKTDADMDGLVSGHEVKDIFMQSGLSQNLLAHIW